MSVRVPCAEVIHGDCLEVMRGMAAGSVDAIVTDPPYGSTKTVLGAVRGNSGTGRPHERSSDYGEWDVFATDWLTPAARLIRDGGAIVAFCPDWAIGSMRDAATEAGLRWRQTWYWYKSNPPVTLRGLMQFAIEPMVYITKGVHACRMANAGNAHNVFHWPFPAIAFERWHPNQKPVSLMREIVRLVADQGDLLCDPFAGSGSTLVAAAIEGFDSIGIERESHYVEIAKRRVQLATAQLRLPVQGVSGQ